MKTCRERISKQFKIIVWVALKDSIFLSTLIFEYIYILLSYNYCEHSKTVITVIMSRNRLLNMGVRVGILAGFRKLVEVGEKYIFSINVNKHVNIILFNKFTLTLLLTGIGRILLREGTHNFMNFP